MYYAAIHLISFKGFKTVKRFTEKYFLQILLKNVGFIGKKPEQGVREMWNLVRNLIFSCSTKILKITFFSRALFIVQIFHKYFTIFFISQIIKKYWEPVFQITFNSSHNLFHILPAACWNCNWFFWKSFFCDGRVQLVPKYISKVKLNRGYSPNILSEIMRFQENGSKGGHFAFNLIKISYL